MRSKSLGFFAMGLLLLLAGCVAIESPPQRGPLLRTEKSPQEVTISIKNTPSIDYDQSPPVILVTLPQTCDATWQEREIFRKVRQKTRRSLDRVEFLILSRKLGEHWRPFRFTRYFVEKDLFFRVSKGAGFYPLSKIVFDKHKPFMFLAKKGLFPMSRAIAENNRHFVGEFGKITDGELESPVFPFFLSDEFVAAILSTTFYPISFLAGLFTGEVDLIIAPFYIPMCPIFDICIHTADFIPTIASFGYEIGRTSLVPTADTALLLGSVMLDVGKDGGMFFIDAGSTAFLYGGAFLVDAVRSVGDAFYPGGTRIELIDTGDTLFGEWVQKEGSIELDYTNYICAAEYEGDEKEAVFDADGSVQVAFPDTVLAMKEGSIASVELVVENGKHEIVSSAPRIVLVDLRKIPDRYRPIPDSVPIPPPPPPTTTPKPTPLISRINTSLIIGIDSYNNYPILQNAVSDAKAVAESLKSHYGFSATELYNAEATRSGILSTVRNAVSKLVEGENLLIYYSGHGWKDDLIDEGYWIPVDATDQSDFISNADIHKYISAMEKAQHVFLVADSCFSGSFLTRSLRDRAISVRPADSQLNPVILSRFFQKMDNRKSRMVLTSGANEPVPDGGRDGHSVFAYYFLRALDYPDEPVFTASELVQRVQKVVGNNAEQTPLSGYLKSAGHEEGQMVFIFQEK